MEIEKSYYQPLIHGPRGIIHTDKPKEKMFAETLEYQFNNKDPPDDDLEWEEHIENTYHAITEEKATKQSNPQI